MVKMVLLYFFIIFGDEHLCAFDIILPDCKNGLGIINCSFSHSYHIEYNILRYYITHFICRVEAICIFIRIPYYIYIWVFLKSQRSYIAIIGVYLWVLQNFRAFNTHVFEQIIVFYRVMGVWRYDLFIPIYFVRYIFNYLYFSLAE